MAREACAARAAWIDTTIAVTRECALTSLSQSASA